MSFRTITRSQLYAGLLILALIIGAIILERVVLTDRERVDATIDAIRDASKEADVDALFANISQDYDDEMFGKRGLRTLADAYYTSYGETYMRVLSKAMRITGGEAAVELRIFATAQQGPGRGGFGRSTWLIFLQKESDGVWRVVRIEPISWEEREIQGWSEIRRSGRF